MSRQTHSLDSIDLPVLEPRTRCVLIPRDPNFVYAYWDYTQEDINRLGSQIESYGGDAKLVLRVYDITLIHFNGSNANYTWDIEVGFSTKNWYVQVWQDNADYCAELGVRRGKNQFTPLTRSNIARTPPMSVSTRNDLIWQDIKLHKQSQPYLKEDIKERYQGLMHQGSKKELRQLKQPLKAPRVYQLSVQDIRAYYTKLFSKLSLKGIFKGMPKGISWQKVKPFITYPDLIPRAHPGASEQRGVAQGQGSSPAGASENLFGLQAGASEGRLRPRKFFFEIWTEVIVHGRTEPDATVLLNQQGVKLNPDGTFSLRYALPDGEIPLKFIAQSSDGMEQRHIYTGVGREKTIYFPKMLREFHG